MDSATSPSVHGIEHGHLLESLTNSASEPISKGLHAKLCDWADKTKKNMELIRNGYLNYMINNYKLTWKE